MTAPGPGRANWLDGPTSAPVLTPDGWSETHRLVRRTAEEFVAAEVVPAETALAAKDWSRARALLRAAGALGLIGIDTPEAWGGSGLGIAMSLQVAEVMGAAPSFAVTFGGQAGLALLPLHLFGSPEQRARYIAPILAGDRVGAYALSEAGAGTDAFSARTSARRAADGSWVLEGEKLWVTNGGFADVFITFARTGGDQLGAFIVEREFPGVHTGAEEHKLGLDGSSTVPLVLTDARVPAANLLGGLSDGRRIALTTLSYGRLKLAATCLGTAKVAIREASAYAEMRRQFGQPIARFGAISAKLAAMAARAYAVESALYRTAGLVDEDAGDGAGSGEDRLKSALERFSVESSILKVGASEMADDAVDELVQIHGGHGVVRDYSAERRYRDARVNRIFEGTNEIHRVALPAVFLKRARREHHPTPALGILCARVLEAERQEHANAPLARAGQLVAIMKDVAALALNAAEDMAGGRMADEQEFGMLASDILIDTYLAESAVLRAGLALAVHGEHASASRAVHEDAAVLFTQRAADRASAAARTMMAAADGRMGDERVRRAMTRALDPWPLNPIAAGRRLAGAVALAKGYPCA